LRDISGISLIMIILRVKREHGGHGSLSGIGVGASGGLG
jgi:hypothetical protein